MVILGIIIGIVGLILLVATVAGAASNSNAPPAPAPQPDDQKAIQCYVCVKLETWWNSLDGFGHFFYSIWYGINKLACKIKGC